MTPPEPDQAEPGARPVPRYRPAQPALSLDAPAGPAIIPLPELTRRAFAGEDLGLLGARLLDRLATSPDDAAALMDLSRVLMAKSREASLTAQQSALALSQRFHVGPPAASAGLRLLALMAPGDATANTPIEFVLDGTDVSLELLFVDDSDALPLPAALPPHDALFVAIGESDERRGLLLRLAGFLTSWPRPVINQPERILPLSRDGAGRLLADLPGVDMPLTARVDRARLEAIGRGALPLRAVLPDGVFPLIARPVGSHMGRGLTRLDGPAAIAGLLAECPERELYLSRYVDYAGPDGRFRKYRVALVDGRPFACHLAVSSDWVVHYQKAGMEESLPKRLEEQRFMERFDEDFAVRHAGALAAIQARVGLDYLGIDCAEAPDGRLLVFEVDNAVLVHAMDPVDLFPYKQPAMRKLMAAFRALLAARVAAAGAA